MRRHQLDLIKSYEVIGRPVPGQTRLAYEPWLKAALRPYGATRLPVGVPGGLTEALHRARLAAALQPDLTQLTS